MLTLSEIPTIHSIEVSSPNVTTSLCTINVVYTARYNADYFQFAMTFTSPVDNDFAEDAFMDSGKMNVELAKYGYVLP